MVLTSWKAIASHLRCSVRSAQRWERVGLPVHRPFAGRRSYVTADSETLDWWLRNGVFLRTNAVDRQPDLQRARELREEERGARVALRNTRVAFRETMDSLRNSIAVLQNQYRTEVTTLPPKSVIPRPNSEVNF